MEQNEQNENEKEYSKRITVYLSAKLLSEVDEYRTDLGYSTRSEMFRKAFTVLRYVYPSKEGNSSQPSIHGKLNSLAEQMNTMQAEIENLRLEREMLYSKVHEHDTQQIDLDAVAEEVFEIIQDPKRFDGSVKDFVIEGYFSEKYAPGVVFQALLRLVHHGKLKEKEGLYSVRG